MEASVVSNPGITEVTLFISFFKSPTALITPLKSFTSYRNEAATLAALTIGNSLPEADFSRIISLINPLFCCACVVAINSRLTAIKTTSDLKFDFTFWYILKFLVLIFLIILKIHFQICVLKLMIKKNYSQGILFLSTFHKGFFDKPAGLPVNILPASVSPFSCHLNQAVATLANSPP